MSKQFTVDGKQYDFISEDEMLFAEARAVVRVSGINPADAQARSSYDYLQAVVWISMKRKEPTLQFSDVDNIPISVLQGLADEPDPTNGEDEAPDAA